MGKTKYDEMWSVILKESVSPIFRKHNYKRYGSVYYKKVEDFWLTFNYQGMIMPDSKYYFFYVGVCHQKAFEMLHDAEFPKIPNPFYSIDYKGVSNMIEGRLWYEVGENTDINSLKDIIENDIIHYALQYLERFTSLNDVIDIFMKEKVNDESQLMILFFLYGNRDEGIRLFREQYQRIELDDLWKGRYEKIADYFKIDLT